MWMPENVWKGNTQKRDETKEIHSFKNVKKFEVIHKESYFSELRLWPMESHLPFRWSLPPHPRPREQAQILSWVCNLRERNTDPSLSTLGKQMPVQLVIPQLCSLISSGYKHGLDQREDQALAKWWLSEMGKEERCLAKRGDHTMAACVPSL